LTRFKLQTKTLAQTSDKHRCSPVVPCHYSVSDQPAPLWLYLSKQQLSSDPPPCNGGPPSNRDAIQ